LTVTEAADALRVCRNTVYGLVRLWQATDDTKTHAARRLRLDAATVEALTLYHSATEQRAAALGTTLTADAFTFSHAPDGSKPISPQKVTNSFRHLANGLDLAHVRLHDYAPLCRHPV